MSQDTKWLQGWNDGVAFAVEELLMLLEPDAATLLMPHVHVDELTREQVRRLRQLASRGLSGKAPAIVEVLRTAKADPRTPEPL